VHHPHSHRVSWQPIALPLWLIVFLIAAPDLAMAQTSSSPFLTGATSLQTKGRTLLAAASRVHEAFPSAQIRAFALVRTMGMSSGVQQLLDPCLGEIRWKAGDACRSP
jgi:hypothetical protein